MNHQRILVTGGAGFIGRALVKLLLEKHHSVVVIDNLSNGSLENIRDFDSSPKFKFIEGDICDSSIYDNLGIFSIIFHLAAQVNVQESIDNPVTSFQNNVLGTYNILEWMRCTNPTATLVIMGTCMVYDTATNQSISEKHPVNPSSPYAGSKLAAEDLALGYGQGLDLDIRIIRPFNTYGPYQKSNLEGGVVNIFAQNYLENKDITVFGDGSQTRDLMFVDDCAELVYLMGMTDGLKWVVINGGTGEDIPIIDLAKIIAKDKVRVNLVEHHHPQSEIQKLQCNNALAREKLNWTPKTTLSQGIEQTLEYLRNKI